MFMPTLKSKLDEMNPKDLVNSYAIIDSDHIDFMF